MPKKGQGWLARTTQVHNSNDDLNIPTFAVPLTIKKKIARESHPFCPRLLSRPSLGIMFTFSSQPWSLNSYGPFYDLLKWRNRSENPKATLFNSRIITFIACHLITAIAVIFKSSICSNPSSNNKWVKKVKVNMSIRVSWWWIINGSLNGGYSGLVKYGQVS